MAYFVGIGAFGHAIFTMIATWPSGLRLWRRNAPAAGRSTTQTVGP
jgi:hypothetical protein